MAQTFHANQSDLQALGKRRWPAIPPAPWAMTASVAAWSQLWTHSSLAWPSRVGMTQTVF